MGQNERELLVWHHRLNHFSFKFLIRLSKMGMIPRNISKTRNPLPCVDFIFGNVHKRPWRTKGKQSSGSIRNPSENRTRDMTSIDQMVYAKPGIITQFTGAINHTRFWSSTVFMDHYSDY